MEILAGALVLLGGILGAIGASTLYWTDKARLKDLRDAYSAKGKNKKARLLIAEPAKEKLKERELWRDTLSLWGWSCVITGSGFALVNIIWF